MRRRSRFESIERESPARRGSFHWVNTSSVSPRRIASHLPAEPRALDAVKASWRAVWLDAGPGEVIPPPRIEWRRNGKAVPALEGKRELPAGTVRRGERWR